MPKKREDSDQMAAESILAAAMLVAPYMEGWIVAPEGTERAEIDQDLPPATASMKKLMAKRGNPFAQKLAMVEKLGRAAARKGEFVEDTPKLKRASGGASGKLLLAARDPEERRRELLVKVGMGVEAMGVNPVTYFNDLARRLRVPVFDSPVNLELAVLSRVARMVAQDERSDA